MKQFFSILLLVFLQTSGYSIEILNPTLRDELLKLKKFDQEIRKKLVKGITEKQKTGLEEDLLKNDIANEVFLKTIVSKYGWPSEKLVGSDGSQAAWLLLQHCDHNPQFQKKCLSLMKDAVKNNDASKIDLAYLTDRVLTNNNKPQRYGTQLAIANGKWIPKPIDFEQDVNTLRKEVGLDPLEDYIVQANSSQKKRMVLIPQKNKRVKRGGEQLFLQNLNNYFGISPEQYKIIKKMISTHNTLSPFTSDNNYLFEAFPKLQRNIPYVSLATLPTPICKLDHLGNELNTPNFFLKNDGDAGKIISSDSRLYGGNKVRKLEFLLAQAIQNNAKTIITLGGAYSNHVVATAAYGNLLGLKVIVMLKPQPKSRSLRKNLLLLKHYGAEIHLSQDNKSRQIDTIEIMIAHKKEHGDLPCFIPTGGSIPVGILGFVNTAFELKRQINAGCMPEPDVIYIPAGSWGSASGLLLGIKAAKLKTKVIAVAVEPEIEHGQYKTILNNLFKQTNNYLHKLDVTFPIFTLTDDDYCINQQFTGSEYGQCTQEGSNAAKLFLEKENIKLDGTYSAKTAAAMLADLKLVENKNKVILYWNTYCSDTFTKELKNIDYHTLPENLHTYYQDDWQDFHF